MDELMRKLLALTDEQFEVVVAGARAARAIVGGPKRIGRPRGSKNAKNDKTDAYPGLMLPLQQIIGTSPEEQK